MPDELIVVAAVFVMQLPLYALIAWKIKGAPVRRVVTNELSPLGSRARVDETLAAERAARGDRQESTEAWNGAGKPA